MRTLVRVATGCGRWLNWPGSCALPWRQKPIQRRITSITKTFVATLILQLVDQGQLRLDDTLKSYALDLPAVANVTIRQLLGMQSGIFNLFETPTSRAHTAQIR
jgi:CubicO group peptidase (beta-lactamase class C family)